MQPTYVIGMGEALWDLLPEGPKLGGAPANFAYHAAQFGLPARIVSAVGDDPAGDRMLEEFGRLGLETAIERVPYPTGSVGIELDAEGVPRYDFPTEVAWDRIPFTPRLEELAGATRAVCFGSLAQRHPVSRATIGRFLDAMPRTADRWRIFDINLRQHFYDEQTLAASLGRCDLLKINDEELEVLTPMLRLGAGGAEARCRELAARYGLRAVVLTCGARGSHVVTPDDASYLATPKVEVVDTVGAGDSFTASFTAALLRGRTLRAAHALAVDVSAWVCTRAGAMPRLPEELLRRAEEE